MSAKSEWPLHPKCGKTFPPGERSGHCSVCCRTFYGGTAFESHRRGPHDTPERRCIDPETDTKLTWRLDDLGRWRLGQSLSESDKQRIFGGRS